MVKVSQTELIQGAIAGRAVSFPTDTVPALASKPEQAKLIFQLKQRPDSKPLILMGASIAELLSYTVYTSEELAVWRKLIDQYLPGALTLILPASPKVPAVINPTNSNTVGIRIPKHPVALEILKETGVLATSSANLSGNDALTTMEAINQEFPAVLVLEGADLSSKTKIASGLPSTIVCWQNQKWQILRQGSVTIKSLN
ncbi:L-threonylcarbamoyladenylate synthase [Pleurocapsa sp. FMAR1]|uniref:L-threonylcarbamoyladenylate synthase n=1 Tax=Pleurocapsa sp. FMAR1 TaxID=3040204 RepID=UPI0029C61961|nr:L-threonylcarbamoyladenylate synthase [Pleurocapsa sp. FMAR1]